MCFGGGKKPPKDNSAELARQEEEARQARIQAGESNIDAQFSQAFSPDYFNNYQTSYEGAYTPDLTDQYQDARKKLTYALSRSGNLTSSSGAEKIGALKGREVSERAAIRNRAMSAVNDLKSRVEHQRNDLYGMNRSAADPSSAAARAAAATGSLQASPTYSPLGDVFASLLNSGTQQLAMESTGRYPGLRTGLFNNDVNSGSVVS